MVDDYFIPIYCILPKKCVVKEIFISEWRIGDVHAPYHFVDTERVRIEESGTKTDVTRLISARMATEFERGLYYGKNE